MLFLEELGFPLGTLRIVAAWLCHYIYLLISKAFQLFMNVADLEFLTDNDVKPIYQRVTIILSIIMIFYVTFEFVKYVVQPDAMTDKEKGASKIVSKVLIVIALLAFVPTIFMYSYKLQDAIFKNELLSKVILGKYNMGSSEQQGGYFAANMFSMFYYVDTNEWPVDTECDGPKCQDVVDMNLYTLAMGRGMPSLSYKINLGDKKKIEGVYDKDNNTVYDFVPKLTFRGLWAVVVGLFILYILVMYVIDVGARVIYLAFLQVIAPIPIISYLSPKKDGMFQKWLKQCTTTYLDVFIRLTIIYFILLMCNIILKSESIHDLGTDLVTIVLVLGLLSFAQKAPKLLQELFPKMGSAVGSFGLKPGERLKTAGKVVGMGAGAAVGAAVGLGTGFAQGTRRWKAARDSGKKGFGQFMAGAGGALVGSVRGTTSGFFRGAYNGVKKGNVIKNSMAGAKKQVESNKQFGNRQENGYTVVDQVQDRVRGTLGFKSRVEEQESKKSPIKSQNDAYQKAQKARTDYKERAKDKIREGNAPSSGKVLEAEKKVRDFKEDPSVKAKYVATKYRTQTAADAAYGIAVQAARATVNRDDYKKFDNQEYQRAKHRAEALVNRGRFTVGEYKTQTDADIAYRHAVNEAKNRVDRSKFTKPDGSIDAVAYQKEMDAAAATVDKHKFTVGDFATEAEAQAAYENAVKAAGDTVNMDDYMMTDEEAYQKALEEAEAKVDKSEFTVGAYATKDEADEAYERDYQAAQKAATDAMDDAIFEYMDSGSDAKITTIRKALKAELEAYNRNAPVDRQIPKEEIDRIETMPARDLDDYIKNTVQGRIDKNNLEIIDIDAAISRIKSQTEGSGIGEGKK